MEMTFWLADCREQQAAKGNACGDFLIISYFCAEATCDCKTAKYESNVSKGEEASRYLFVEELSGVFLDVTFIQVCGQTHQTDF